MGFKTIKKHYDIKHIVQVRDKKKYGGRCICIGSPYAHDIIVIRISDAKIVKCYAERRYGESEDLVRYDEALDADEKSGILKQLIDQEDVFENNLPVFTIRKWRVIECLCEEYGWPNTTHEGSVMNDSFFKTREEAYKYLVKYTSAAMKYTYGTFKRRFVECCKTVKYLTSCFLVSCFYWLLARTAGRFITRKEK
jgi:hypothetical protein